MKQFDDELEEIIGSYSKIIRKVCRRYYLAGATQDDLYQEGMIGVLEAYHKFDGKPKDEEFKKFAIVCAKHKIFDAIRKSNSYKNKPLNNYVPITMRSADEEEEFELSAISLTQDQETDPAILFLKQELVEERVQKLGKVLSEYENQVIKMYLDGESQSEIARHLNKDKKSIDNTIQRVKNKLKEAD